MLVATDFVPEPRNTAVEGKVINATTTPKKTTVEEASPVITPPVQPAPVLRDTTPVRIVIDTIELDTPILSPESTDIAVLDRALLAGAVRYPNSAHAGERGNMLVFGHSSYLPIVQNEAFQAFNKLDDLTPGDRVAVYSSTHTYTYEVQQVELTRADEAIVNFDTSEPLLTLATCNSFGAKQERWVVQARFINATPLET
jgi:LPXTG-site transpeptidase (sortase) family protein